MYTYQTIKDLLTNIASDSIFVSRILHAFSYIYFNCAINLNKSISIYTLLSQYPE